MNLEQNVLREAELRVLISLERGCKVALLAYGITSFDQFLNIVTKATFEIIEKFNN